MEEQPREEGKTDTDESTQASDNDNHTEIEADNIPIPEVILPEELKPVMDNPDIPEEAKKIITATYMESTWRGPLPPPWVMEEYKGVIPDMPERILRMTEKQSDHRRELEKRSLEAPIQQGKRGQIMGFCIAILFLIASTVLAFNGYEIVASVIGGTTVVGLVTVFVTGKRLRKSPDPNEQ